MSETHPPLTTIRRRDRAVHDEDWLRAFLGQMPMATLALVSAGQPYITTNLFVYDAQAHCIYTHTARTGRTPASLADGAEVCLSVSEMGRLLPAPVAREFSVEYASVVVFGQAETLADEAEARHGLQLLLDKYFPHLTPGQDYRPITREELASTSVYRIRITGWSAKRKQAPPDFPGAFWYPFAGQATDHEEGQHDHA